jgi:hypothetical protein
VARHKLFDDSRFSSVGENSARFNYGRHSAQIL